MEQSSFNKVSSAVKNWWVLLIIGLVYAGLGVWTFLTPAVTYLSLSILFATALLFFGALELYFSLANRKKLSGRGWYLAGGILNIILSIMVFRYPGLTALIFTFFVGFWLMFAGIRAIGTALELRTYTTTSYWGWLLLFGILMAAFSFFITGNPVFGSMGLVMMTSLALLSAGIYNILLSFRMRRFHNSSVFTV